MNRWKIIALVVTLLLIASKLSYDYGASRAVERISLVEYYFRVVDAESGETIPSYSYTFPNTQFLSNGDKTAFPRYSTHRKGAEFSIFFAVADRPLEITIGADGFSDQSVTLNYHAGYSSSSGSLPINVATIALEKEAQQGGDGDAEEAF